MALGGVRGSTDGATAVSTGAAVPDLGPESVLAYEGGVRWHSGPASASLTVFDLEFHDAIERRTVIFPSNVVGQEIAGFVIVRQDTAGRAFVAADARPLVTRVNVSHIRVRGFEAETRIGLGAGWRLRAWGSSAQGREVERGTLPRRMPPALGGAALMFQRPGRSWWVEGTLTMAAEQDRLSDGDIGDARIGASRTPATIAAFFSGTAADRGLVKDGPLVATGETVSEVQARVLGTSASLPMFTSTPGFAAAGLRAGVPLGSRVDLILIGENLTDPNYRIHGSGVDEPGIGIVNK